MTKPVPNTNTFARDIDAMIARKMAQRWSFTLTATPDGRPIGPTNYGTSEREVRDAAARYERRGFTVVVHSPT